MPGLKKERWKNMIPYEIEKVSNLEDVREKYPQYFYLPFLKRKEAIKFYNEELEKLKTYWGDCKKIQELQDIARARALYNYLWCIDNITITMTSWGWKSDDILILIRRMKLAGHDPWTVSDITGEYLHNLRGHGFIEITRPDGSVFTAYDPEGKKKPRKVKSKEDFEEENILWEDQEKNPFEVSEEDDYDDK